MVELVWAKKDYVNIRNTLHSTQSWSTNRLEVHNRAPHPYTTRSCEYSLQVTIKTNLCSIFAPCLFSLSFDVYSFVVGALSSPCYIAAARSSSRNPTSLPWSSSVAARGRSLCFYLFPSCLLACLSQSLVLMTSHRIHELQTICITSTATVVQYQVYK